MWCEPPGTLTPVAERFVQKWLETGGSSSGTMPARILQRLRQAGFSGCGEHVELAAGFFFPYSSPTPEDDVLVAVATGLKMPHGAPGLLLGQSRSGIHEYRSVGILVGPVPESGEVFKVG